MAIKREHNGRFAKGTLPPGRQKGVLNKIFARTRDDVWAYIEKQCADGHNANPFQVLIDTMIATHDEAIRVKCAQTVGDKLLPNLKAVEAELGATARDVILAILRPPNASNGG
jgi:hypothetical protein